MSSSLQAAMDMGILASSEPRPTMTTLPPATQARMPVCSSTHTACQRVAGRSSSVGVIRLGSVPLPFVKLVCAALAVMMSQLSISCSVVHQHTRAAASSQCNNDNFQQQGCTYATPSLQSIGIDDIGIDAS